MEKTEIYAIADEIIQNLRDEGYDAFIGGYYDVAPQVRAEIVKVLTERLDGSNKKDQ